MLKLDLSKAAQFLPEGYVAAREEKLAEAADMLANRNGPGGDFTGWVYLPRDYDKEELARIKAAALPVTLCMRAARALSCWLAMRLLSVSSPSGGSRCAVRTKARGGEAVRRQRGVYRCPALRGSVYPGGSPLR